MIGLTRRAFVRSALLAVGLPLAAACGAPVAPASPTSAPAATSVAPATTTARPVAAPPLKMPTYVPAAIAPPDLPGDDTVEPGYFAFPKQPSRTVTDTPIKGGAEVNVMTWNVTGPIAPLESNTAWQAINQQVGAKINLVNNVSNSDYRTKLTAVVAGGELPDTMYIPATPGGQSAPFPQFPDFLEKSAADLTPYLSGDAVKEFPNGVEDPAGSFYSETHAARGSIVNQGFLAAMGDIIAGRRPFSDYDGLLKEWQSGGGNQIRAEFEQAIAAG